MSLNAITHVQIKPKFTTSNFMSLPVQGFQGMLKGGTKNL